MNIAIIFGLATKLLQIISGKELAKAVKQFKDIVVVIKKARQDGTIKPAERKAILKEIGEFADSLADLVKSI